MFLSFFYLFLLLQPLYALPLVSTPYHIRNDNKGNCIVSTRRDKHGATVKITPLVGGACPGDTVVNITPVFGYYLISGKARLYITPSKHGRVLVWGKKPYAWQFSSAGFGYYIIEDGRGRKKWMDNPLHNNVKLVGGSTETGALYWTLGAA